MPDLAVFLIKESIMTIRDAAHARELAQKAKALKATHNQADKAEFEEIKTALLSQGYGALVREYGIESWDR